jgi:trimeric autotransporter adhesin
MRKFIFSIAILTIAIATHAQSWSLAGNAGTNPTVNFLGTTDNNALRFRVNNNPAGEINHFTGLTSFGWGAGQGGSGANSVAIGYMALYTNPSYQNTAVGSYSLLYNNGSYNCALGYGTLYLNTSGHSNTAMGYAALLQNTTGFDNVAIGRDAMRSNSGSYGSRNTAIGSGTLFYSTNAQYNTALGFNAGMSYDLGWNNTILGANCGGSFHGQYNMVAIGQGVVCPNNSTARIGNSATWSIGGYASWSNFSDGRFKKDIQENVKGLDFILKLRPVTYRLDISGVSKQTKENGGMEWDEKMKEAIAEKEKLVFTGFIAQEVEAAAKAAGYDFSGVDKPRGENEFYALRYSEFVVPLVKAMQEQQQLINDLQKRIKELERKPGARFNTEALKIQPNPANNRITVTIESENASPALIKIFDSKGALVKTQQASLAAGNNQLNIDLSQFAKGIYHISAEWDNGQVKRTAQLIRQ